MIVGDWEIVRHQAAIAGRITDLQTGKGLSGVFVEIVEGSTLFQRWLGFKQQQYGAVWAFMAERPGRTKTAADGHYHFLDLPDGDYTLEASLPQLPTRYGTAQVTATVVSDAEGTIGLETANMTLPPSTIKGHITGPDGEGGIKDILMAEVRLTGSGERAFSNDEGQYLLSPIEPGTREIRVSAQGYQTASQTVVVTEPGAVGTLDFVLALQI